MVGQSDVLDDRKPQSDTILGMPVLVAAAVESLKNTALFLLRDTATAIKHADQHPIAVLARFY